MPVDLSPEDQLCLLLAHARFSENNAKQAVEPLISLAGWDAFFESARAHGLIPLVYHRLNALGFSGVPADVRRKLTDAFGVNAVRNEMLARELVRVLTRLSEAGIPVIPLKGVALAETLYGDAALRTCADLDVLIHPSDLQRSLRVLILSGYRHASAPPPSVRLLARHGRDCALVREDERWIYPLQVHCGLIWGGPAEHALLAGVWTQAAPQPFRNAPAYSMSPVDEFLYLAVHAARHGLASFKWLVDIDWIVARGTLDWTEVFNETRSLGWERMVGQCVSVCSRILNTPIPQPFAQWLPPAASIFRESEPGALEVLRQSLYVARLLPSFARRIQFIATRVFIPTSADGDLVCLPSALFFLYFILRPCRLILTLIKWLIQAGMSEARGNRPPATNR